MIITLCNLKGEPLIEVKSVSIGVDSIVAEVESLDNLSSILSEEIYRFKMGEDYKEPFKAKYKDGLTNPQVLDGCSKFITFRGLTYRNQCT